MSFDRSLQKRPDRKVSALELKKILEELVGFRWLVLDLEWFVAGWA